MLAYFPLEHIYYLASHSILPTQITRPSLLGKASEPINIDIAAISRNSTRLWAFYVLLQIAHLREDRRLLKVRERAVGKLKAGMSLSYANLSSQRRVSRVQQPKLRSMN